MGVWGGLVVTLREDKRGESGGRYVEVRLVQQNKRIHLKKDIQSVGGATEPEKLVAGQSDGTMEWAAGVLIGPTAEERSPPILSDLSSQW